MEYLVSLLYGISGFCVGVLVGMTGVGGGSLMTPLLILLFGVHPTTAVGTDLLFAASTKARHPCHCRRQVAGLTKSALGCQEETNGTAAINAEFRKGIA
jgi:uncharacterized membrane protein YfcA